MIPPEQVAEIEARLQAATPGPWTQKRNGLHMDGTAGMIQIEGSLAPWKLAAMWSHADRHRMNADAQLIANAPTDLRALLNDRAALVAERDRYEKVLRHIAAEGTLFRCLELAHAALPLNPQETSVAPSAAVDP